MIEEDFYCTLKLKSGEEVFAKVAASEEEERTFLIVSNPIVISEYKSRGGESGYKIVKNIVESDRIAFGVLYHHEKHDGTGYPFGLKGDDIPLSGRIVCVVDVFDALVSYRPYKLPWSFDQAAEHLRSEKGKQFDPVIVDVFLDNFNEIQDIFNTHQDQLDLNV